MGTVLTAFIASVSLVVTHSVSILHFIYFTCVWLNGRCIRCNYAIIMYVKSCSAAVGYVVLNFITLLFDLSRLCG